MLSVILSVVMPSVMLSVILTVVMPSVMLSVVKLGVVMLRSLS